MATEEIDYSLPYEEYLKNFRKTHPHQAIAMSKDQYEAAAKQAKMKTAKQDAKQAKIEAQNDTKAIGATKEEIDYSLPYEQARAIYGTGSGNNVYFISKDTFEKNKAKIEAQDDTKAIGATKEELDYMLQNGQISKAAYDKQIAALNTPEVQEEMARGEKKADENVWDPSNRDKTVADSISEAVTPKEGDSPTVISSKDNYNKAMMSIWDAYRAGEIGKETAGYFTIDAIATLAKNLGRSIGNVGAQFSGGTIDNGHDESKWGQRQDALLNEAIGKETEGLGGAAGRKAESENLDLEAKKIRNAYTPKQLEQQIEMFKKDLEMADINLDMAHSKTDLINFIKKDPNYVKSPFKMGLVAYLAQAGAAGAANNASKTLGDAINWILTLAK